MTVPLGIGNKGRKYVYSYDSSGRQIGSSVLPVSLPSSTAIPSAAPSASTRFSYDAAENRVKLVNKAGAIYYFVYDPTAAIPAVVYEQGPQYRYLNVRNPEGYLVTREKYSGENRVSSRTYHFDGNGNTLALSDENGNITDNYTYDAWGNLTSHTGPGALTADNPYQFGGEDGYYTHYQEPSFAFLQTGYRYYDPASGRYTQLDPIKDGLDWYAYCGGNPVGGVDPWGLRDCDGKDKPQKPKPSKHWWDGWLDGSWGEHIPVLGDLAKQAGTDYGNWESGRGSGWKALGSSTLAVGATVTAAVGVEQIGAAGIGWVARSLAPRAITAIVPVYNLTAHAMQQMANRGITANQVETVMLRGDEYWDPLKQTPVKVLPTAGGHVIYAPYDPVSKNVITVIDARRLPGRMTPIK